MNVSLEVKNIYAGYGKNSVVKDISFSVPTGKAVALIGLNGVGKTTTINSVINYLKPTDGSIVLNGQDSIKDYDQYQSQIGYIPETPIIYDELTLDEHLNLVKNDVLDSAAFESEKQRLLNLFRLDGRQKWFPMDFSKGMKQKVMIIMALLSDAKLLVIDEPFLGLDPLAVVNLIDELNDKKKAGVSMLLSTHVLESADKLIDAYVLLDQGQVAMSGSLKDIYKQTKTKSTEELYLKLAKK